MPVRARPVSAIRNDLTLERAAIEVIADSGWDAASMLAVSSRAGLTYGAVYSRFDDRSAWGVRLWESALLPALQSVLSGVLQASAGTPDEFEAAMSRCASPSPTVLAAVEVLLASRFDPVMRGPIESAVGTWLGRACLSRSDVSAQQAVVAAAGCYLAFGLVLASRRPGIEGLRLSEEFARYHRAFGSPAEPRALPKDRARHLEIAPFNTGDERIDRVFHAAVRVIGEVGYHRATTARICRASGVSAGFLYKRYSSKLDLAIAATDAMLAAGFEANAAFTERLTRKHGVAIAEAVTWRELQRPELQVKRALDLETNRLAMFDVGMRAVRQRTETEFIASLPADRHQGALRAFVHTEIAMGLGVHAVANLVPRVWKLPFNVVTEPLLGLTG
ncbi:MAG: TetR family transcriptional regulator [Actinobacteria bacterium]|nr:TetR family transcriptional regulator [Actinomycetota bacterium]